MVEGRLDAAAIVNVDREEAVVPRTVPNGDDRGVDALEVLHEARLVPHVADNHDPVALSRFEHRCERQRLVGTLACVAEHNAVPALARPERERVDRARGEHALARVDGHSRRQDA